jgi:putative Mg2+ transporter-C (MgtC) family protein
MFTSILNYINNLEPTLIQAIVAVILGAAIGLERELAGKDPSLRTFALISLGSCIFSMASVYSVQGYPAADPSRISAQIVSGIGFIGAGAIFRSPRGVSGLTTAALMWLTAAIGMAVGFNQIKIAVEATIVGLIALIGLKLVHKLIEKVRGSEKTKGTEKAKI